MHWGIDRHVICDDLKQFAHAWLGCLHKLGTGGSLLLHQQQQQQRPAGVHPLSARCCDTCHACRPNLQDGHVQEVARLE